MEKAALLRQGKKLGMLVAFLATIAFLVGGEDNPGMLAQISKDQGKPVPSEPEVYYAPTPVASQQSGETDRERLSLDDWYAEVAPGEPTDPEPLAPEPIDDSHLIDDTEPLVSTEPAEF